MVALQQLPQTSSAVNIQIIEPKNFADGATPGQINYAPPGNSIGNVYAPSTPAAPSAFPVGGMTPSAQGMPFPANYNNPMMQDANAFSSMNPQQALENAYTQALNARNQAEQARNSYLNLGNQLNQTAYQQQQMMQPQFMPMPLPYNPAQMMPNPPMPPYAYGAQAPSMMPAGMMPPEAMGMTPDMMQAQAMMPPGAMPPGVEQGTQAPPVKTANIEQLNTMIDMPASLQERVNAMEEIGIRGLGTPKTYDLLQREALADTSHLTGMAREDANYVRQAALWTLGMLNRAQNSNLPGNKLPGLNAIEQILDNRTENSDVKAAAVQSLQVLNRPTDKRIKKLLEQVVSKEKNQDLVRLAKQALSGKTIPIPTSSQQPALNVTA